MEEKTHLVKKSPVITLAGSSIKTYAEMVIRLIKGGRINKFYPDMAALCNLFNFLIPENTYNMYDTLEINYDTGLPSEKEITRVIVDREIAPKTLEEDKEETLKLRASQNTTDVNLRRLNRYMYHREILKHTLPPLMNVKLKLRSVDTEKYIAFFNAEVERFEMSSSLFAKYTLVIGQEDPVWNKVQQVSLIGDDLKYTQNFRNLISQYTVHESEFTFILLNELDRINVEEVQRCRVGPLYFKGVNIPAGLEAIFEKHPDTFILALPSDRTSIFIKEDKNTDPLVTMYRDALDAETRSIVQAKAEKMGYHVYKERKFVCTKNALKDFQKFLADRGARCVVYGV